MQCRRPRFDPWVRKIAWRREWQPTPVFWPGKFHGQRSLAGYSPWGCKESHTTEPLTLLFTLLVQSMVCIFRFLRNCQGVHQGCILSPFLFNLYAAAAAAAAAAKSPQSFPTLCDPIDGSPPGSAFPGILQARTLEWVAISFSNAWKWVHHMKCLAGWITSWNQDCREKYQ